MPGHELGMFHFTPYSLGCGASCDSSWLESTGECALETHAAMSTQFGCEEDIKLVFKTVVKQLNKLAYQ